MDGAFLQGLRDAKALLDDGIFSQEEFESEKAKLTAERDARAAAAAQPAAAHSGPDLGTARGDGAADSTVMGTFPIIMCATCALCLCSCDCIVLQRAFSLAAAPQHRCWAEWPGRAWNRCPALRYRRNGRRPPELCSQLRLSRNPGEVWRGGLLVRRVLGPGWIGQALCPQPPNSSRRSMP